jgi:hypothetical protein
LDTCFSFEQLLTLLYQEKKEFIFTPLYNKVNCVILKTMRDIVWTLIVVWVIYKLVETFKGSGRSAYRASSKNTQESRVNFTKNSTPTKKSADSEGEYVDYEEIP